MKVYPKAHKCITYLCQYWNVIGYDVASQPWKQGNGWTQMSPINFDIIIIYVSFRNVNSWPEMVGFCGDRVKAFYTVCSMYMYEPQF
jgi:hypothetical protein